MKNQTILENLTTFVTNFLENNRIQYFIGGSKRFKYDNKDSDYDIFINYDHNTNIINHLLDFGFIEIQNYNYKFQNHFRLIIAKNHIDLLLIDSNTFYTLEQEHNYVENYLKENINLKRFIKLLKYFNQHITGAEIYKLLLFMINKNHE